MVKIVRKKELNPTVTLMEVEAPFVAAKAQAGQFIILRVDEEGERIPLTISSAVDGLVTVIYQKIGGTTLALDQLNQDDCLQDFVGPLGVPTHVEDLGRVAVLGGGLGCAIALPVARGLHQAVDFRNGTGLKAAMWVGAQMCPASHTKMVHGEGPKVRFEMPYLFLDRHGKRFMDEGCCRMGYLNEFTNKYLAEVDFKESTAAKFFSIVPSNWQEHYEAWKGFSDISIHNAYRNVDPEAWIKGDTLEELADMLGFAGQDKENFLAEVERYNGFFDKQVDEDFGKEAYRLSAIRQAPFYGCWFGGSLLTTIDGLRINENCQVLDPELNVIEGLYAAGDVSGSFFSGNYPEYIVGVACGRSSVEGRHVAKLLAGAA